MQNFGNIKFAESWQREFESSHWNVFENEITCKTIMKKKNRAISLLDNIKWYKIIPEFLTSYSYVRLKKRWVKITVIPKYICFNAYYGTYFDFRILYVYCVVSFKEIFQNVIIEFIRYKICSDFLFSDTNIFKYIARRI